LLTLIRCVLQLKVESTGKKSNKIKHRDQNKHVTAIKNTKKSQATGRLLQ